MFEEEIKALESTQPGDSDGFSLEVVLSVLRGAQRRSKEPLPLDWSNPLGACFCLLESLNYLMGEYGSSSVMMSAVKASELSDESPSSESSESALQAFKSSCPDLDPSQVHVVCNLVSASCRDLSRETLIALRSSFLDVVDQLLAASASGADKSELALDDFDGAVSSD